MLYVITHHGYTISNKGRYSLLIYNLIKIKQSSVKLDVFIEKSSIIHNNKYDYSLVEYKNNKTKVKIICPEHGEFEQLPIHHLNGSKCLKCSLKLRSYNNESLKDKFKEIHGNKYDYSKINYISDKHKVEIVCKEHGSFFQLTGNHINQKQGCPNCANNRKSKGEKIIEEFLLNFNIKYEREKLFNDCKRKRKLPFDFYLPDYNLCIEYDGLQHFKEIKFFGGKKGLDIRQKTDILKSEYCDKNAITLIRITYKNINMVDNILNQKIILNNE